MPRGQSVEFPVEAPFLAEATSWTLETHDGLSFDVIFEPAGTAGYADLVQDAATLDLAMASSSRSPRSETSSG